MSAALGARRADKPAGLEAQLKLGAKRISLLCVRWREIPRVLQRCWPWRREEEEEEEGGGEGRGGEEVEVRGERSLLRRESIWNTGNWA